MSDYVIETISKYCAPKIDPASEVDEKWVTRSAYRFVDVEWFIDTCIRYPREAVNYGLMKNRPFFVNCFYPKDVSIREDDECDE